MSNWQTPITTWGQAGQTSPGVDDFNRMEGNIAILGKYDRAPGYGEASGTNAKTITLSPAPGSYYEGLCFAFKNITENTGAVTINVNGMGAKSVKKPNGNDLVSGNLKAGSVYTVRYNGTNFILQGSDSAGDATPGDVRAGKTFSNDAGTDQVGTLPEKQGDNVALSSAVSDNTLKLVAPGGIYDGADDAVTITDNDWVVDNIKAGVDIFGKTGTYEGTAVPAYLLTQYSENTDFSLTQTYQTVTSINVYVNGVITVYVQFYQGTATTGNTFYAKIGAVEKTWYTTETGYEGVSFDISVSKGNTITVQAKQAEIHTANKVNMVYIYYNFLHTQPVKA